MHRVTATSSRFVQLVLLAALTAGGCAYQSRTEPVPPELLMRTYNVRRDQSDAAVTALTAALQGAPKGSRVEQLSDGRVLLVAPAEVHAGVDALVRGLDANKPIRAAELDYWVVLGEPAAAYARRLLELPSTREWEAAALREPWREVAHESEIMASGTLLEDRRAAPG